MYTKNKKIKQIYVCFFCFFCVHEKKQCTQKKKCTQKKQNKQNKTICSFSPHPIISFAISLLETSNMAQIIVPQLPMSLIQASSGEAGSISPLSFFPLVVDLRGGGCHCRRRHQGMGGDDDATVDEVQLAGVGGTQRQTMTSMDPSGRGRMVMGRIPPHNDDEDISTSRAVVLCGGPVAATSFWAS